MKTSVRAGWYSTVAVWLAQSVVAQLFVPHAKRAYVTFVCVAGTLERHLLHRIQKVSFCRGHGSAQKGLIPAHRLSVGCGWRVASAAMRRRWMSLLHPERKSIQRREYPFSFCTVSVLRVFCRCESSTRACPWMRKVQNDKAELYKQCGVERSA